MGKSTQKTSTIKKARKNLRMLGCKKTPNKKAKGKSRLVEDSRRKMKGPRMNRKMLRKERKVRG